MLSLVSLFVVLGFLVLVGLLANAGRITSRKLETQNAADSVAYSAGTEMARGMNSVTAINHLIGELTALVVLIHTLGGDELDQGKDPPPTPRGLQTALEVAYDLAKSVEFDTFPAAYDDAYDEARKDSKVGGAIYDARMRLKMVLAWAYQAHFMGGLIAQGQFIPIVGWILEAYGDSVCAAAYSFEFKVWLECETLNGLEELARILQPVKVFLRDMAVPGLNFYETGMVYAAPPKALVAANAMDTPNLADEVSLYPPWPFVNLTLPVEREPDQASVEKSQLMRASTPWIQWWRQPWIDFGKEALLLSRFAAYFEKRSTQYTLSIIKKLKQDKGIHLYVMAQRQGRSKTYEPWTHASNSNQVDRMFTVVGLAHRPAPGVASSGIFRFQENPDGLVCYAQAMFYNANPQRRGSGDKNWQPTAGWDTLNWDGPAPEYPGPVPSGDDTPTPTTPQPRIRLNWQCKLVPTTRLPEATFFQLVSSLRGKDDPIRTVLWRTLPASETPIARTH